MTVEFRLATESRDLETAMAVRIEVFVAEQGVPEELGRDEHDAGADHAVALLDGRFVGTGRLASRHGGLRV